jgi:hypothetical protein
MTPHQKSAMIERLATLLDEAPTYFTMRDISQIAYDYIEPQIREECAQIAEDEHAQWAASAIRKAYTP